MSGRQGRRSWRTVSLRMLLVLMLVCGCGLGMIGRESRHARRRVEAAKELSTAASKIDTEYVNLWGTATKTRPPAWQAALLGEGFFQHVTKVVIDAPSELPDDGALLGEFCHLRSLEASPSVYARLTTTSSKKHYASHLTARIITLGYGQASSFYREEESIPFSDTHAAGLIPLRNLQTVSLSGAELTDEGLACISPRNPLESLDVSFTSITDRGVDHIVRFPALKTLDVSHTWITDDGLARLAELPRLETLRLTGLMVTDVGLRALSQCNSLQRLELQQVAISAEGIAELARLPNLQSVAVDGAILNRPLLQELQDRAARLRLREQISAPNVMWAIDRAYAPHGLLYLKWLLEQGADPDARVGVGSVSPIAAFAQQNDLEVVQLLVEHGADVNGVDASCRAALSMAAERGHVDMMQWLIDHGAKINVPASLTPLCSAASAGQVEAARLLIERGADVNLPNHHGDSPLHLGVWQRDVTRLLLEAGADPNAADPHGQTPLHVAMWTSKQPDSIQLLLKHGADATRRDAKGKTAFDVAVRYGKLEFPALVRAPSQP